MSSKRWLAACTGVQARVSAQKSPDFAPTLRDSVFADARSGTPGQGRPVRGGLRRCLAGRANPRNSTAIAAVSRAGGRPLASHPAKPLSRREEIVGTFLFRRLAQRGEGAVGGGAQQPVRFQLSLWEDGLPLDAQPAQGWIEFIPAVFVD